MFAKIALPVLALASAALAAPTPLVARDCSAPGVNTGVRDQIYKTVLSVSKDPEVMLITMVTALTESGINDLPCGDNISVGVFQQKPGPEFGWCGKKSECMDVVYSTKAFLKVMMPILAAHPDEGPGAIAQATQEAAAGDRYTANIPAAQQIIKEAAASVGNDTTSSTMKASTKTKTQSKTTESKTTEAQTTEAQTTEAKTTEAKTTESKTTESKTAQDKTSTKTSDTATSTATSSSGAENVEGAPPAVANKSSSSPDCGQWYAPVTGEYCLEVSAKFKISLDNFYDMNPGISRNNCPNMDAGEKYCVAPSSS